MTRYRLDHIKSRLDQNRIKGQKKELSLCCCFFEFHALCDHQTAVYSILVYIYIYIYTFIVVYK